MQYLIVDGMLSGTGIRDAVEGGYIEHDDLGLSSSLSARISSWLACYEESHYEQFQDSKQVGYLDAEGLKICSLLQSELPDSKISYFSNARMMAVPFSPS